MSEPAWLLCARKELGLKEIKGPQHNPRILEMWKKIRRSGIKDDETPWCAAFVGACLETVGIMSTRYESAKSYLSWGQELHSPELGCIVVFTREGGGHVGFVVGKDEAGRLLVLGGNQGDQVCIRAFDVSRVSGFRWPSGVPLPSPEPLPRLAATELSRSES